MITDGLSAFALQLSFVPQAYAYLCLTASKLYGSKTSHYRNTHSVGFPVLILSLYLTLYDHNFN
jgi:hypothetical protein